MACGMAGHIQHLPVQRAPGQGVALGHRGVGHGQFFEGRAIDLCASGLHQIGQTAGVIGVVVRD